MDRDAPLTLPDRARPDHLADLLPAPRARASSDSVGFDASGITQMSFPLVHLILSTLAAREGDAKVIIYGGTDPFFEAFTTLGLFSNMMKLEFAA